MTEPPETMYEFWNARDNTNMHFLLLLPLQMFSSPTCWKADRPWAALKKELRQWICTQPSSKHQQKRPWIIQLFLFFPPFLLKLFYTKWRSAEHLMQVKVKCWLQINHRHVFSVTSAELCPSRLVSNILDVLFRILRRPKNPLCVHAFLVLIRLNLYVWCAESHSAYHELVQMGCCQIFDFTAHKKKCVWTEADFDHRVHFFFYAINLKHDLGFDCAHRFSLSCYHMTGQETPTVSFPVSSLAWITQQLLIFAVSQIWAEPYFRTRAVWNKSVKYL